MLRTTAIKLQRSLQSNLLFGPLSFRIALLSSVQAIDVSLMMFRVMQLHYLLRDVRFEGLGTVAAVSM
jgi:hypothetical protein